MQLRTVDGNLTLGSAFKVIWVALSVTSISFAALIIVFMMIAVPFGFPMDVNGAPARSTGSALLALAFFAVVMPFVIVLSSLFNAAFLTLGLWLYRFWRPLSVVEEKRATT